MFSDLCKRSIQTKLCLAWFIARDTVPHTTAHRYSFLIIHHFYPHHAPFLMTKKRDEIKKYLLRIIIIQHRIFKCFSVSTDPFTFGNFSILF
ncbi:MAG: hypothetical protein DWQ51_09100 [Microcystis wesenbergii TW10]|uniref:Uncharacterized protein n=1 Tax=Microcystis wesenbergii TW10 TaxID=2060474 RepID=A0A3E0M209_9CHRO|nr:MAG: hypothetical protein DWQ51_09100 [Microcystis wesenbergii TW10]